MCVSITGAVTGYRLQVTRKMRPKRMNLVIKRVPRSQEPLQVATGYRLQGLPVQEAEMHTIKKMEDPET